MVCGVIKFIERIIARHGDCTGVNIHALCRLDKSLQKACVYILAEIGLTLVCNVDLAFELRHLFVVRVFEIVSLLEDLGVDLPLECLMQVLWVFKALVADYADPIHDFLSEVILKRHGMRVFKFCVQKSNENCIFHCFFLGAIALHVKGFNHLAYLNPAVGQQFHPDSFLLIEFVSYLADHHVKQIKWHHVVFSEHDLIKGFFGEHLGFLNQV